MKHIGVLGLQGAYAKHADVLKSLGIQPINIRQSHELQSCDGLIIPGGESTTMTKLIYENEIYDSLVQFAREKPVFGTCAGMILMATRIDDERVKTLNLINMTVDRNAYGSQVDSFIQEINVMANGDSFSMRGIFIRAPRITNLGEGVEVLAYIDQEPVLVRQGHHIAAAFHPELTNETRIHHYFSMLSSEVPIV